MSLRRRERTANALRCGTFSHSNIGGYLPTAWWWTSDSASSSLDQEAISKMSVTLLATKPTSIYYLPVNSKTFPEHELLKVVQGCIKMYGLVFGVLYL